MRFRLIKSIFLFTTGFFAGGTLTHYFYKNYKSKQKIDTLEDYMKKLIDDISKEKNRATK